MAYVGYSDRDDMQNDTYKIITGLIIDAIGAYQLKDLQRFHTDVDSLYLLTWMRLPKDNQPVYERKLMAASTVIYAACDELTEEERAAQWTTTFDDLRQILKEITGQLDEKGILFKMRSDPGKLVTHGGMH